MISSLYQLGSSELYKFTAIGLFIIFLLPFLLRIKIDKIVFGYIVAMPFTIYLTGNTFFNFSIVVGLLFLTIRYCSKNGKGLTIDSVAIFSFLFTASFLPAILFAPSSLFFTQVTYWLRYLSGVLFYIVVINAIDTKKKLFNYTWSIIIIIIFYSVASLVELIWFPYHHPTMGWRLRGPFREYELFSEFLAMMFPLSLYMIGKLKSFTKIKRSMLLVFFSVIFIVFFILTGTRGGPVALAAGLVVFIMLSKGRRLSYLVMFGILMLLVMPLSVSIFSTLKAHTRLSEVDMDLFSRFEKTQFQTAISHERGALWEYHLGHMIAHGYWVFGEGPAHPAQWLYSKMSTTQNSLGIPRLPHGLSNNIISFPHCLYITLLQTGGVGALVTFIFIVITLFYKLMLSRKVQYGINSSHAHYINMLISILFIFIIDEVKIEFIRYHTYVLFIFGGIFGLIGAGTRIFSNVNHDQNCISGSRL